MDWNLFVACMAVVALAGAAAGYILRDMEKDWQRPDPNEGGSNPL